MKSEAPEVTHLIFFFFPLVVIGGIICHRLFSLFYTIGRKDPEEAFFFFLSRAQNNNRGFYSTLFNSILLSLVN